MRHNAPERWGKHSTARRGVGRAVQTGLMAHRTPVSSVILKLCQRMLGDNTDWTPEVLFGPLSCYIVTQFWARFPCRPGTQHKVGTVSTHRLGDPGQHSRAPVTCVTLKC